MNDIMNDISTSDLLSLFLQHRAVSTDTRTIQSGELFFALKGANFDGNTYAAKALEAGASHVILDDPAHANLEDPRYHLVPDALKALQDLARAYRMTFDIPVIGITGSNGKTTTKELLQAALATERKVHATRGNYNNHIGVPLTLLSMPPDTEVAVVEMGANQPGDIAELAAIGRPTHGLITSIGEAHLERFKSVEGVRETKGQLFDFVREHGGIIILNTTDPHVMIAAKGASRVITYGKPEDDAYVEIVSHQLASMTIRIHQRSWAQPLDFALYLSGDYNAMNALAAVTIGTALGLPAASLRAGIASYRSTNNRSQLIEREGYQIWLDAYNANPTSMEASLKNVFKTSSGKRVALIIGDMFELGDQAEEAHRRMGRLIQQLKPAVTVGVGKDMRYALEEIQGTTASYERVGDAVAEIADLVKGCDLIVLKGSRGMALERLLEVI